MLVAALRILTGEGSWEDVETVETYRVRLPKYGLYNGVARDGRIYELEIGFPFRDMDAADGDPCLGTQQNWENYEDAVLEGGEEASVRKYTEHLEGLFDVFEQVRLPTSGRAGMERRNDRANERSRGRSPTRWWATAARVAMRDRETSWITCKLLKSDFKNQSMRA